MADTENLDQQDQMSESERAHIHRRDRKRITKMVVDNAGIKRILAAREARKKKKSNSKPGGTTQPPDRSV